MMDQETMAIAELRAENEELRRRLEDAEATIGAIRQGAVDALVGLHPAGGGIYTLDGAERPYRILIERMQQGAAVLDANGTILYCNRRLADLLGTPHERLTGAALCDFVPPDAQPACDALLEQGRAGNGQGETRLRRADGASVPVYFTANALPLNDGSVLGLLVTDLTEQKRQEEVIASATLAHAILEQGVDAVVICDPRGHIINASRAAYDLCGANPLCQPFATAFPLTPGSCSAPGPAGPRALVASFNPVLCDAAIRGAEFCLRRPDGMRVDVLLSAGPLTGADGQRLGFVVTLTDISERKRNEEALRENDRRKDEFLAMLAHELRNPLAPIHNGMQVLRLAGRDDPTAGHVLEMMDRQIRHLVRLVDDLLEVSRITRGKIKLRRERIELSAAIRGAIETSRPLIEAAGHELTVDLPPEPMPLHADLTRLAQVLTNLLNNAAKYTPPGGHIWVSARREGAGAVVRVADTGVGIPAEVLPHVFDLFVQEERSLDRSQGGLGIGLTLVKRIVEMHGGTVEARSAGRGGGSEFTVRLPLAAEGRGASRRGPPGANGPPMGGATPPRVLAVDDNRDAVEALAMLLKLSGYEARTACDGPAALEAAADYRPDAVLLDIGMPGMDGYEVARRLRQLPATQDVLLIALTGYGDDKDRRKTQEAGFDHHLLKPLDFEALSALLPSPAPRAHGASSVPSDLGAVG